MQQTTPAKQRRPHHHHASRRASERHPISSYALATALLATVLASAMTAGAAGLQPHNALVELFAAGPDCDARGAVAAHLTAADAKITEQQFVNMSLSCGFSFAIEEGISEVANLTDAVQLHAVAPSQVSASVPPSSDSQASTAPMYSATSVGLNLTDTGLCVAVADTGLYYGHPALGGCFGPGCKVAFGRDLVGDYYSSTNTTLAPDADPLDACSASANVRHVAGAIAADSVAAARVTAVCHVRASGTDGVQNLFATFVNNPDVVREGVVGDGCATVGGAGAACKTALIRWTSGCSSAVRCDNASSDGAFVCLIFSNVNGSIVKIVEVDPVRVHDRLVPRGNPAVTGVARDDLLEAAGVGRRKPAALNGGATIEMAGFNVTTAGLISEFSTPGPQAELRLGPDVAGITGGVAYAVYVGTSMATPFLASCAGLFPQVRWRGIGAKAVCTFLQNNPNLTTADGGG
ncbi:hypothetical protein HK405_010139, partial [Cladochytrium tenue]